MVIHLLSPVSAVRAIHFSNRKDDHGFPPRASGLVSFFRYGTCKSADCRPGKPEYFASATLMFCRLLAGPTPISELPIQKTREAKLVLLCLAFRWTVLLRTFRPCLVLLFG